MIEGTEAKSADSLSCVNHWKKQDSTNIQTANVKPESHNFPSIPTTKPSLSHQPQRHKYRYKTQNWQPEEK